MEDITFFLIGLGIIGGCSCTQFIRSIGQWLEERTDTESPFLWSKVFLCGWLLVLFILVILVISRMVLVSPLIALFLLSFSLTSVWVTALDIWIF